MKVKSNNNKSTKSQSEKQLEQEHREQEQKTKRIGAIGARVKNNGNKTKEHEERE